MDLNNQPIRSNFDERMRQYERSEREFHEFLAETQPIDLITEEPDQPLSGLQCLLNLTEILERAVKLRKMNFELEQKIDALEMHYNLQSAITDINTNGILRNKKSFKSSRHSIEDHPKVNRTVSSESLDTADFSQSSKTDIDVDQRYKTLKGSRLSETWGKVKEKLSSKEPSHNKSTKRGRSATDNVIYPNISAMIVECSNDLSSFVNNNLTSSDSPSNLLTTSAAITSGQFTQREIVISVESSQDFGGVWLGEEERSSAPKYISEPYDGGVYMGPPDYGQLNNNTQKEKELFNSSTKEKTRRKSSEPSKAPKSLYPKRPQRSSADTVFSTSSEFTNRFKNILNGGRKLNVFERPAGLPCVITPASSSTIDSKSNDYDQSPLVRKRSAKSIAKVLKLSVSSEQKKTESTANVSRDFAKKLNEWTSKNDGIKQSKQEVNNSNEQKWKAQKLKSKHRATVWTQRSKSAERADPEKRNSDDFEEKLREWSVKKGYHPSYYSDIRASLGSMDSFDEQPIAEPKNNINGATTSGSQGSMKSSQALSSGGSVCSLPVKTYHLASNNLQTLHEISQSADLLYQSPLSKECKRKISRSAEALNTLAEKEMRKGSSLKVPKNVRAKASNVDVYAKASEDSLEKHLSLCHFASDMDINNLNIPSPDPLLPPYNELNRKLECPARDDDKVSGPVETKLLAVPEVLKPNLLRNRPTCVAEAEEVTPLHSVFVYELDQSSLASKDTNYIAVRIATIEPNVLDPMEVSTQSPDSLQRLSTTELNLHPNLWNEHTPNQHIDNFQPSDNLIPSEIHPSSVNTASIINDDNLQPKESVDIPMSSTVSKTSEPNYENGSQDAGYQNKSTFFQCNSSECENEISNALLDIHISSSQTVSLEPLQHGTTDNEGSSQGDGNQMQSEIQSDINLDSTSQSTCQTNTLYESDDYDNTNSVTASSEVPKNGLAEHESGLSVAKSEYKNSAHLFNISKIKKTSLDMANKGPLSTKDKKLAIHCTIDNDENFSELPKNDHDIESSGDNKINHRSPLLTTQSSNESVSDSKTSDSCSSPSNSQALQDGRDINCNDLVPPKANCCDSTEPISPSNHIYHSIDVPLKLRLKSLAQEYEGQNSQLQSTDTSPPESSSGKYIHKRTRSHDFLPSAFPNVLMQKTSFTKSFKSNQNRSRPSSLDLSSEDATSKNMTVPKLENTTLPNEKSSMKQNPLSKPHRSSVQKLKSADELLSDKQADNRPFFRREIPKVGTVQKARSLFMSNETFNSYIGTDFTRPKSQQTT